MTKRKNEDGTVRKTGGRMSPKKFDQQPNSIMEMLQLPGNEEMRKRYNKNLREAKAEAHVMEMWAAADFGAGMEIAYIEGGEERDDDE